MSYCQRTVYIDGGVHIYALKANVYGADELVYMEVFQIVNGFVGIEPGGVT